jgi:hypothetical protein
MGGGSFVEALIVVVSGLIGIVAVGFVAVILRGQTRKLA